jgi:hypothetical protein
LVRRENHLDAPSHVKRLEFVQWVRAGDASELQRQWRCDYNIMTASRSGLTIVVPQ